MSDLPISSPYRSTPDEPVTDDERNRLNQRLTNAFSAGTIGEDDYNARLDRLWAAKHLGELVPVVEGLPPASTYNQPAIVSGATGTAGTPGELAPTRSGVPMTVAIGAGVVLVVLLVVIIVALVL